MRIDATSVAAYLRDIAKSPGLLDDPANRSLREALASAAAAALPAAAFRASAAAAGGAAAGAPPPPSGRYRGGALSGAAPGGAALRGDASMAPPPRGLHVDSAEQQQAADGADSVGGGGRLRSRYRVRRAANRDSRRGALHARIAMGGPDGAAAQEELAVELNRAACQPKAQWAAGGGGAP